MHATEGTLVLSREEYERLCKEIDELINRRKFRRALREAEELVARDANEHAQPFFFLHLATCLASSTGANRSAGIIVAAQHCEESKAEGGLDPLLEGDMHCDRALGILRSRIGNDLTSVDRLVEKIRGCHGRDENRIARLMMVEGRLAYARGDYWRAIRMHRSAAQKWARMPGDSANAKWVYNNLVHWLKVEVTNDSPWSFEARRLARQIRDCCPPKMRNRKWEARLIRLPLVGNWLDDLWRAIA